MVTARITTILVKVLVIINAVIVYIHIKSVGNTVIVVVVNVCVRVAIIDFFPIVYPIAICVIVFMVFNAVIIVVVR